MISPGVQAFLSGTLTLGVPLLLAIRELIVLDRDRDGPGDRDDKRDGGPEPTHGGDGALPPLPPCLVPRAPAEPAVSGTARPRVLEDA